MAPLSFSLLLSFTAFIIGIIFSKTGAIAFHHIIIFFLLSFIPALVFYRTKIFSIFIFFALISLGFMRMDVEKSKQNLLYDFISQKGVTVNGYIVSVPVKTEEKLSYFLKVVEIDKEKINQKLNINVVSNYNITFEPGDYVSLRGAFKGGRGGIVFKAENLSMLGSTFSLKRYIFRLKERTSNAISFLYPSEYASFIKATILGESFGLSKIRFILQDIGLAHILAISGLHVGLVLLFFNFLFKLLRMNRRLRSIILAFVILLYLLLTGARYPVLRASLMALMYIYFWFFYTKPNPFNVLLFAALLIILIQPEAIFSVSFLLSFAAMAGIFLMLSLKCDFGFSSFKARFIDYVKVSSGAWFFVTPLVWYYWGKIALFSLLLNLALLPLFSFALASAFASILSSFIFMPLAKFFAVVAYPFLYILFLISESVYKIPYSSLKLPSISIAGLAFLYAALILIIFIIHGIIKSKEIKKS